MTTRNLCIFRPALFTLSLFLLPLPLFGSSSPFTATVAHADCYDPDADPDLDSDGDDVPDCEDECPNDRRKVEEGVCGCNIADADGDKDGWIDQTPACQGGYDLCPSDPEKVEELSCGCGFFEPDPFEDGTVECDNPDEQDIRMRLAARGGRITVKLSRFQGNAQYVVTVQKQRAGSRRYQRLSGYPRVSSSPDINLNLARGNYRIVGQVRRGADRSLTATRSYSVTRR